MVGMGGKLAPLWLVIAGILLVIATMATIVAIKPLDFSPPKPADCAEGSACTHEAAPVSGEAPRVSGEHAPATSHEAAPEPGHHE